MAQKLTVVIVALLLASAGVVWFLQNRHDAYAGYTEENLRDLEEAYFPGFDHCQDLREHIAARPDSGASEDDKVRWNQGLSELAGTELDLSVDPELRVTLQSQPPANAEHRNEWIETVDRICEGEIERFEDVGREISKRMRAGN